MCLCLALLLATGAGGVPDGTPLCGFIIPRRRVRRRFLSARLARLCGHTHGRRCTDGAEGDRQLLRAIARLAGASQLQAEISPRGLVDGLGVEGQQAQVEENLRTSRGGRSIPGEEGRKRVRGEKR